MLFNLKTSTILKNLGHWNPAVMVEQNYVKESYMSDEELEGYKGMWQSIAGEANLKALMERLKEAENLIDDLVLSHDHAHFCRTKTSQYEECSCMDRNHYNEQAILERAEAYQKKWELK